MEKGQKVYFVRGGFDRSYIQEGIFEGATGNRAKVRTELTDRRGGFEYRSLDGLYTEPERAGEKAVVEMFAKIGRLQAGIESVKQGHINTILDMRHKPAPEVQLTSR